MRKVIVSTWTVALLTGAAGFASVQEEARALIERAVKAHGGAEALGRIHAERVKFKGSLVIQDHATPILVETTTQLPSKAKWVIEVNHNGDKHTIVHVVNGDKIYITVDGRSPKVEPAQLSEIRNGLELERRQASVAVTGRQELSACRD